MVQERHLESDITKIRADHIARYERARDLVSGIVLDAACGCGYGSNIISQSENVSAVFGFDVDEETVKFANEHWKNGTKVEFYQKDLCKYDLTVEYDWLVSFETLEHLDKPEDFLSNVKAKKVIASVPNQVVFPFRPKVHIFHKRHYTPQEFRKLFSSCGYKVNKVYYQQDSYSTKFNNTNGKYVLIEATKI